MFVSVTFLSNECDFVVNFRWKSERGAVEPFSESERHGPERLQVCSDYIRKCAKSEGPSDKNVFISRCLDMYRTILNPYIPFLSADVSVILSFFSSCPSLATTIFSPFPFTFFKPEASHHLVGRSFANTAHLTRAELSSFTLK